MAVANKKVKINGVRLGFPSLFKKAVYSGEATKFCATFLIPKDSEDAKKLRKLVKAMIEEEFGGKKIGSDKVCLKDGDEAEYDGFEGMWSIKASNDSKPTVLDRDRTPLTADDGRPYAGCYVNAIIEIWAQDNSYGKRINATLLGVQFAKDGEPFAGGRVASADDFDDVPWDDDDDDDNVGF
jgi:hypothetical protein